MNKKNFIIMFIVIILIILGFIVLSTGRARTDVYLKDYDLSSDGQTLTLKVGVLSSSGYVRKMKQTSGSMNYYLTFYSTFGIHSKLGAKDTYTIKLDSNVDEIYFYTGKKGYKKVLEKNESGTWVRVLEIKNLKIKTIVDQTTEIEKFVCAEALEQFYEDDNYDYFFNCIKGKYVVVLYETGEEETVESALKNGNIKIADLDFYNIDYLKYEKTRA